ncbi:hypothetical protein OROMI_004630 [Orobanche minor]
MDGVASLLDLPEDVIGAILSNIDVKSVARLKSVCKSWQSIISNPRFARTHHLRRSQLPENQNKSLLVAMHEIGSDLRIYLLKFQAGKFLTESVFPYQSRHFVVVPLCSCDGLVLIADAEKLFYMLWNPSIGKTITIHGAGNPHTTIPSLYYDSVAGDYKIAFFYDDATYAVYSCKDRMWSEARYFPCERSVLFSGDAIDGCFYGLCGVDEMVCFDAREGRSGMLRQPEGVKGLIEVKVRAISGRLCLFGLSSDLQRLQMWVMEKRGRSFDCSWRKLVGMEKAECGDNFRPLFLSNEDEVVMSSGEDWEEGERHLIYNPGEKRLGVVELDWEFMDRFIPYWENLYMPRSNVEEVEEM